MDRPEETATATATAPAEVVIGVCVTCRDPADPEGARPGVAFLDALRLEASRRGSAAVPRPVQCFGICTRPCTAALSGPGRYSYLFADLEPGTAVPALIEAAVTYAAVPQGYMLWRERPESLRRSTVARIPPVAWIDPEGRHPR